jgi:hypothetical protein
VCFVPASTVTDSPGSQLAPVIAEQQFEVALLERERLALARVERAAVAPARPAAR